MPPDEPSKQGYRVSELMDPEGNQEGAKDLSVPKSADALMAG